MDVRVTHPDAQTAAHNEGRRRRRRDNATVSVTWITAFSEISAIVPEWHELYERAGRQNPFASPDWLVPWARHFVAERDLALAVVRRNGELIGLAPWYVKRTGKLLRRLQLLGSGRHDILTELPQVLALPGESRSVLRAVINELCQGSQTWDWFELPLMVEQGWFEPEWLVGNAARAALVQHKITRAATVMTLPMDKAELEKTIKRNLLESIHRARNRLTRESPSWTITVHEDVKGIEYALPILARLHGARSNIAERRHHPDYLSVPSRYDFLVEAVGSMAKSGRAQILTVDVGGTEVAAQLILHAPDSAYVGFSGIDPQWWHLSAVTLLQWHAAEAAVERGHQTFNLSVGPNTAKLRWSEQIVQHPEFLVCAPRRSSKLAFTAYRGASAVDSVRREALLRRAVRVKRGA
jgi:CelD/BcsL family acetyltransferase involved in cellulose biosynthesis